MQEKSDKSPKPSDPLRNPAVEGTPSPPPNAGIAQNKGSVTGNPQPESKDTEDQENSSPEADVQKRNTPLKTGTSEVIETDEDTERSSDIEGFSNGNEGM